MDSITSNTHDNENSTLEKRITLFFSTLTCNNINAPEQTYPLNYCKIVFYDNLYIDDLEKLIDFYLGKSCKPTTNMSLVVSNITNLILILNTKIKNYLSLLIKHNIPLDSFKVPSPTTNEGFEIPLEDLNYIKSMLSCLFYNIQYHSLLFPLLNNIDEFKKFHTYCKDNGYVLLKQSQTDIEFLYQNMNKPQRLALVS